MNFDQRMVFQCVPVVIDNVRVSNTMQSLLSCQDFAVDEYFSNLQAELITIHRAIVSRQKCCGVNRSFRSRSQLTERITRRHTPREARPFRVYGQPARSRVHWHKHKSSLPKEENIGDTSEFRTRDRMVTSRARYHCAIPAGYK